MSIQLKLDAAALAALFPEGSQVRLELQQAVINETVRKIVDRELSKTRDYISTQCKKTVEHALVKEGFISEVWTGAKLSAEYEAKLQSVIKESAQNAFYRFTTEAMAPMLADLDNRIKNRMESEMTDKLAALAKQAMRDALK